MPSCTDGRTTPRAIGNQDAAALLRHVTHDPGDHGAATAAKAGQENFPVASLLIRRCHRESILAFYRFARAADDVADSPLLSPAAKLGQLDSFETSLLGGPGNIELATTLRSHLVRGGIDFEHARDLLRAFRLDVIKRRYRNWSELIGYCRLSAMPVGRFMLDLHGEGRESWRYADPLCAALQVINHLQDCALDYRTLDRVYLPEELLEAVGSDVTELACNRATPRLRTVIAELAERAQALLAQAAPLASTICDRRLGFEVAVIQRLAESLAARLRRLDPLSKRVRHTRLEALTLAATGAIAHAFHRR
jgi:squalene synthase HpnC